MEMAFVPAREALVAQPVGRVDESSWEEFGAMLARGIEQAAAEDREIMIIDLSRIDYMSSRGLRVLTTTKARGVAAGVSIRLAAPNDIMREILAISRYDRLFDVDDRLPAVERN
jgi:anti-anti-sigma factor